MLVISVCAITATCTLYCGAACGAWERKLDLVLLVLGFLSAWFLWPPAAIMGLSGSSFPQGYMITGAILGHAQALINPYLYGVRWRSAMAASRNVGRSDVTMKEVEQHSISQA